MTDRSKLLALAEEAEKLTRPDRATDAAIFQQLNPTFLAVADGRRFYDPETVSRLTAEKYITRGTYCTPNYTASLDAAMTLATGYILLHLSDIGADGLPLCRIGDGTLAPPVGEWVGIASDLPRSVVAACLRARAQAEALA